MPISFTRATWADYVGPPFMQASEANRWETALDALINGSSRAVYRDGDTITGNLTVNGWIEADQGFRDAGGVTRISATGAGALTTLSLSGALTGVSATFTGNVTLPTVGILATGHGYIRSGSTAAVSSGTEIVIATGTNLTGTFDLRWTASNRVEHLTIDVSASQYDDACVVALRKYLSYNGEYSFSEVRVRRSADGATRYLSVIMANTNSGTNTIAVLASGLGSAVTIGGSLVGTETVLKTLIPNRARAVHTTGSFEASGSAATTGFLHSGEGSHDATRVGFGVRTVGDSYVRWAVKEGGLMEWGDGSTTRDTNLYRSAASVLKTDDAFEAAQGYRDASGVVRVSATGAGILASVTAADLTANLPVYADASKKLATESASAFRTRIGAQAQDAKLDAISAGETAARVWSAKYNATVSGYSVTSVDGRLRFGNGVWLYLSSGSTTILKSTDDGATWSTITPGATFYDLCWHSGASLWVAVGTNICYTSPDGTTWTARTIPAGTWRACASNGTTVIAGSGGGTCNVAYSTNATSWTSATAPTGTPASGFSCACWAPTIGKFLLIGSGNASVSTTGTSSWSALVNPSTGALWCGELNGRFVAVDTTSGAAYSTDGTTWSPPRRNPSAKSSFVGFATNGIVGLIGGYSEETQAVSTDGETWLPVDFGYTGSFHGIGYGNGWFLVLDALGYVYRSRG